MVDFIRNHKPEWTSQELDIIYKGVYTNKPLFEVMYDLRDKLPNRSLSAIKNKFKKVKYGK